MALSLAMAQPSVVGLIELGHPCDECGATGELPDGLCWLCRGSGYIVRMLTLDEFRALTTAGASSP